MAKTQAERAKAYRDRKRDAKSHESVTNSGCDARVVTDPLLLYSPARWSRLRKVGYVMPNGGDYDGQMNLDGEFPLGARLGYARKIIRDGERKEYSFGVPAPGDPGYEGDLQTLQVPDGHQEKVG